MGASVGGPIERARTGGGCSRDPAVDTIDELQVSGRPVDVCGSRTAPGLASVPSRRHDHLLMVRRAVRVEHLEYPSLGRILEVDVRRRQIAGRREHGSPSGAAVGCAYHVGAAACIRSPAASRQGQRPAVAHVAHMEFTKRSRPSLLAGGLRWDGLGRRCARRSCRPVTGKSRSDHDSNRHQRQQNLRLLPSRNEKRSRKRTSRKVRIRHRAHASRIDPTTINWRIAPRAVRDADAGARRRANRKSIAATAIRLRAVR